MRLGYLTDRPQDSRADRISRKGEGPVNLKESLRLRYAAILHGLLLSLYGSNFSLKNDETCAALHGHVFLKVLNERLWPTLFNTYETRPLTGIKRSTISVLNGQ